MLGRSSRQLVRTVMSEVMKVSYSIRAKFAGGGIGSIAYHAVKGIYRHQHLKTLFVPSLKPSDIPESLIRKIPVDAPKKIRGVRRIYPDYLEDNLFDFLVSKKLAKSDIFHGWNHHCLLSLRKAKKLGATTVVERASSHILTQNEMLQEEYKRWGVSRKPIHPFVIKKCLAEFEEADYITVPSQFVYDSMVSRGVPPRKLLLTPFGVGLSKFGNLEKLKSQRSKGKTTTQKSKLDKFVAIFVGEVGLRKGVPYLLQGWTELNLKNAELWLAGAVVSDIKKIVSKYYDRQDIKFLGFRRDVPKLMSRASIFVFPSIEEGSALVTYEAMAAGLPVVTTVNSGSVVRDGREGFVLPIRDVEALKEKIGILYNDAKLRKEMGESARQRIRNFTWYQYGENLVKAYEKILS